MLDYDIRHKMCKLKHGLKSGHNFLYAIVADRLILGCKNCHMFR